MGINRFYCCGKLASVTLSYGAADNHDNESAKNNNCCKHEKQSLKLKDSHVNAASIAFNSPQPMLLPASTGFGALTIIKQHVLNISYQSNAPPGCTDIPIYSLNCTYRI